MVAVRLKAVAVWLWWIAAAAGDIVNGVAAGYWDCERFGRLAMTDSDDGRTDSDDDIEYCPIG